MAFGFSKIIKVQVTKMATKTQTAFTPKGDRNKEGFEFGMQNPAFALRTSSSSRPSLKKKNTI